jgi:hypothetical protein
MGMQYVLIADKEQPVGLSQADGLPIEASGKSKGEHGRNEGCGHACRGVTKGWWKQ